MDFGPGREAEAVSSGAFHTCTLLSADGADDSRVRCWGFGRDGRLGYGNEETIGDDETPGSAGPVRLGEGRTAKAITAGGDHSCAVLDDDSVRCWGFGGDGRLGYGDAEPPEDPEQFAVGDDIGDDETPGTKAPIDLGVGRTATAISAGENHTCALLDDGNVRCWGFGANGRLGYDTATIGRDMAIGNDETPGSVGPVDLGDGSAATAISAGSSHTCALLEGGDVRCWGLGVNGRLGYGNQRTIGDDEPPASVGPVDFGEGRTATAISAGDLHTCALLGDGQVRCWGFGSRGRLGYGSTEDVGDEPGELATVGPVDLGPGRTAVAISAGGRHTCALLDDRSVRCWGEDAQGRLGYCIADDIGDDETPGSVEPVNVTDAGDCSRADPPPPSPSPPTSPSPSPSPPAAPAPTMDDTQADRRRALYARAFAIQRRRKTKLRACFTRVTRAVARKRRRIRRRDLSGSQRRRARRSLGRHRERGTGACRARHGRRPGQVRSLSAVRTSEREVLLTFRAPGTHGRRPPAARRYVVKQSRRPIRGRKSFRLAAALCSGSCAFDVAAVDAELRLTINRLRPRATYYYAVAARDNVSGLNGRRSRSVEAVEAESPAGG